MSTVKQSLLSLIQKESSQWLDEQPAWLGDASGTVQTDVSGTFYARLINGKLIRVYNQAHVAPIYDMIVLIGRKREMPTIWQIIAVNEAWTVPAASGQIEYHESQHEFGAGDMIPIDRKQITYLSAIVSDAANFIVQVYGGIVRTGNTNIAINNQSFDMTPYKMTAGAVFANIEADENGNLVAHQGVAFGSKAAARVSSIPVPAEGNVLIASVLMYEGQTTLGNDDILIPLPVERGGVGAQIYSAQERYFLQDDDYFGFYKRSDARLRKISIAHLKRNLAGYTEQLFGILLNKLTSYVKSGDSAGGDLAGTYPNPSVASIRATAIKTPLSPANGDVLTWNNTAHEWEAQAVVSGSISIEEVDGSPSVLSVTQIIVSNGTLTDNGGGSVTIVTGGGGGSTDPATLIYKSLTFR